MLAHDPVGVAHQLGHGELAGKVGTGLEPLDDRGGELDDLAVQLDLGRGQLGDVRARRAGRRTASAGQAAELRELLGRLGQAGEAACPLR